MKQINKLEYTPIIQKNEDKSVTATSIKIILVLFILLSGIIFIDKYLLHLYFTDIEKQPSNYHFKQNVYNTNYTVSNYCTIISNNHKFDCFPRGKADQKSCEERKCCWSPSTLNSQVPWCYYPSNYSNYKVINATKSINSIVAYFNLTTNTSYNNDIKMLCMSISFQTEQQLRIKVLNIFSS